MFDQDKKVYIIIFLISISIWGCFNKKKSSYINKSDSILKNSVLVLGNQDKYNRLYYQMSDTLKNWISNKLIVDTVYDDFTNEQIIWKYKLDSIFCINTSEKRMIGALYQRGFSKKKIAMDDIHFFYGEKINNQWYFWTGATVGIYREIYPEHDPTQPLSYSQLHEQALKEVFGGYLTKDGQINEEWFAHHFEKGGRFSFEDRYKYKWILDGERIDNYDEWYKYTRKRTGLGLWIGKMTKDSINRVNQTLKPAHITREEENEIAMYFSRKLVNGR